MFAWWWWHYVRWLLRRPHPMLFQSIFANTFSRHRFVIELVVELYHIVFIIYCTVIVSYFILLRKIILIEKYENYYFSKIKIISWNWNYYFVKLLFVFGEIIICILEWFCSTTILQKCFFCNHVFLYSEHDWPPLCTSHKNTFF